ncbi:MAG: hypothetical protein M3O46_17635, partial [Myxococcota bacterium]|nr:hypothetical protein [Myxococcota bacterium]
TALLGSGNTCAPGVDSQDEMCSQVGTYQPALWCNRLAGGASGTCAAPLADTTTCYNAGAGFYSDYGCSSLMCGDLGCGGTTMYPTAGFCANWPADAGGGG